MWGRKELTAFGAALAVIVVVAVGYGLARGEQVNPAAGGNASIEQLGADAARAAPVTAEERRTATERLRSTCRDLEVRLTYNGPLEARPIPEPSSGGGLCARRTLTDADVLRLRYAPTPPPGELRFADEQELARWKRDMLCRRPEFRATTSASGTAEPGTIDDRLRGICTKPTLGPDELRTLRTLYVEDPVAAERARLQREREQANLRRAGSTP